MTASVTRALCGVLVLSLSGAPTALSACAAWCLPGMSHGAAQSAAMTVTAHPAAVADAGAMGAAAHAHHHVAAAEGPTQPLPSTGSVAVRAPGAGPAAHGCCPDASTLAAATVTLATSRADARSTTWALAARPARHLEIRVTPAAPLRLSPAATRPRPQAPLVLRV